MKLRPLAVALILATAGCQAPGAPAGPATSPKPKAAAGVEGGRPVTRGTAARLIGLVKFAAGREGGIVSNATGQVVSNHGGGLVSDNGSGLVSDNGSGLVSDNGSGMIGKTRLRLAQASAQPEAPGRETWLADAVVEVLDAAGRPLTTADGRPLTATTDRNGAYRLEADLPDEALVLRVKLFKGGELLAVVPRIGRTTRTGLDTASSLGAAYVLDTFVAGRAGVLDRLPATEDAGLRAAIAATDPAAAPVSYVRDDLTKATAALRGRVPAVAARLDAIAALLLAGQADLGRGLAATQVSLATPVAIAPDGAGGYFVAETTSGRIRRVDAAGKATVFAGGAAGTLRLEGAPAAQVNMGAMSGLARGADGTLYVARSIAGQVVAIGADGLVRVVAGTGVRLAGAVGGPAAATALLGVGALATTPDGGLLLGERPTDSEQPGRILRVTPAGLLEAVPTPEARWAKAEINGLAVQPDGTIWALNGIPDARGFVARLAPGGAWQFFDVGRRGALSQLAAGPDGTVYMADAQGAQVVTLTATGLGRTVAGTGEPGFAGDGGPATAARLSLPSGMWAAPDGTLFLADAGNGLVRAIDPAGTIRTVAGAWGVTQTGDALTIALNQPSGLAVDGRGDLVIAEAGAHVVKRLRDGKLETLAGSLAGFAGDGGPAAAARLTGPAGVAYAPDGTLYVLDVSNQKLRRIAPDGTITTAVGTVQGGPSATAFPAPARQVNIQRGAAVAVGPDGLPYWVDNGTNQICRLSAAGLVELVAGAADALPGDAGDGGPAAASRLSLPTGLAFDRAGNLFVADTGNMRVRKIDPAGVITTVGGLPLGASLAATGADAAKVIWFPLAVCVGPDGAVYVSEAGTTNVGAISPALTALLEAGSEGLPTVSARIHKLGPDGTLTPVAGEGTRLLADPATDDTLRLPAGLLIDQAGRLVVADLGLNQIKVLPEGSF